MMRTRIAGESENRNKEIKRGLQADHLSDIATSPISFACTFTRLPTTYWFTCVIGSSIHSRTAWTRRFLKKRWEAGNADSNTTAAESTTRSARASRAPGGRA
jgi:hypothetical protein